MENYYLTHDNIDEKTHKWLSLINQSQSRLQHFRLKPDHSALLVIDMQSFFLSNQSHAFIPSSQVIISNVNSLVDAFRESNLPIIFTYHALKDDEDPGIMGRWWGDVLRTTDPLSKIDPTIHFEKKDRIIRKTRYSAFQNTGLLNVLEKMRIHQLIITGVMTHLCCETTAREGFMRDFEIYFIVDATATDTEELHVSSIQTLSDGFVIPMKTDDILKEIR
jgi:isochorismate hydrolase